MSGNCLFLGQHWNDLQYTTTLYSHSLHIVLLGKHGAFTVRISNSTGPEMHSLEQQECQTGVSHYKGHKSNHTDCMSLWLRPLGEQLLFQTSRH